MTIRLLFVGSGNPLVPSSGMDVCVAAHLRELAGDARFRVMAIQTTHEALAGKAPPRTIWRGVDLSLFAGDLAVATSAKSRLMTKLACVLTGHLLATVGFRSAAARRAIRSALRDAPDVLVIDHLGGLANIGLPRLLALRLAGRTRVVHIVHDVSAQFVRDAANFKPSRLLRSIAGLQAAQVGLFERIAVAAVDRVVFISAFDQSHFPGLPAGKAVAQCPTVLGADADAPDEPAALPGGAERDRYVVFIGSPGFYPNAHAIRWIVECLAPALTARDGDIRILLVGKRTEAFTDPAHNVYGLGFVPDDVLQQLLRGAGGLISPVVLGSGLKIKILEAIGAGCPVLATAQSLNGYEFMSIPPMLDIDDAEASAAAIHGFLDAPNAVEAERRRIAATWAAYRSDPANLLATLVADLAAPSANAEVTTAGA